MFDTPKLNAAVWSEELVDAATQSDNTLFGLLLAVLLADTDRFSISWQELNSPGQETGLGLQYLPRMLYLI